MKHSYWLHRLRLHGKPRHTTGTPWCRVYDCPSGVPVFRGIKLFP